MDWQEKYELIIDEVSMLGARTLYAVNEQLRRLRESTEDFGGIPVVILCGDLHQFRPARERSILLPSSSFPWEQGHGFGSEQRRQHDVAHALWRKFTVVMLKEQARAAQDPQLRALLTRVSEGSAGSIGCRVSEQQLLSRGKTHSVGVRHHTHVPEAAARLAPHLRFRA